MNVYEKEVNNFVYYIYKTKNSHHILVGHIIKPLQGRSCFMYDRRPLLQRS